jgi:23S rRNA (guanine745-N1)-methyltransferase
MWACPHCRQALCLLPDASGWVCTNKHQFDRAKEGYVNLLPSNRKRSAEPGDNPRMIAARHRVHAADVYLPLARGLQAQLAQLDNISAILDLGCGEGYYCGAVSAARPDARVCGIDISRAAVRLAAKAHKRAGFAVASAFDLPLLDDSQDAVLRVFAPSDDAQMMRVLRPGGHYLEVTPAPRHLWELRQSLYGKPREHEPARSVIAGMQLQRQGEIHYPLELDEALLADLVSMTPYAYRGHREKREALLQRGPLTLTMAFSLNVFQLS